ncbi:MAG: rhodanese-like domain-containing protein [Synechococcales bacterium]|nr:rhodanese-like domain-containing protein [Synechococcales bacterium]
MPSWTEIYRLPLLAGLTCLLIGFLLVDVFSRRWTGPPLAESSLPGDVWLTDPPGALTLAETLGDRWVVSADEAKQLIQSGATLLDARGKYRLVSLPGAVSVSWRTFSQTHAPHQGKLLATIPVLTQRLREVGVANNRPVVVVGDPIRGWGEEGRIVWMLRSLGHNQAVMVDGGYRALVDAGFSLKHLPVKLPGNRPAGDFVANPVGDWTADQQHVKALLNAPNTVILDTREPREYAGATPYGEKRGGHLPGAVPLYFKELLGEDGRQLSAEAIATKLAELGVTRETTVITYCTGGVRSAWLTAVLTDLGFRAKNYPGSMWEWSSLPAADYPLVRTNPGW